jgi:predicted amidophosphoribosyltransferase
MGPGLSERIRKGLLDLFYPRLTCPVCGCFGEGLCPECEYRLAKPGWISMGCGEVDYNRGFSLYGNNEVMSKLINTYKSKGSFNAFEMIMSCLTEEHLDYIRTFDWITFAPSSESSISRLGFDHGYLIARRISELAGVPVLRLYTAASKEQKQLDREERRENVKSIGLDLNKDKQLKLRDKRILIVDDIMTTGNTLQVCRERIQGHACEVECMSILCV